MVSWSNWSGRQTCSPQTLHFARSEADVVGVVRDARRRGVGVRVAGAGHSHAPLVPTDDVVLDLGGLAGVITTDATTLRARIRAGTPIHALGRPLLDAGLALRNQGDIDRQAIAGATATGTHGTGRRLQNLSSAVVGARVVLSSGDVIECSAGSHADVLDVLRLNLGAVGVVTELELQLRASYRLREGGEVAPFDLVRPRLEELCDAHRHFELFWYPQRDRIVAKWIDETDDEPEYPLAAEGSRCGWSHEVLPNHRPDRHTEMEYSVPIEHGPACFDEIRALLLTEFPTLRWPVEYRTLAADDVWLSTAHGRDVATISVHQGIDESDEPLFRACEAVFRRYDGRPHWGKVHYLDGDALAAHPRWHEWWARRDELDPTGTFLNPYLRALRPSR